MALDKALRTDDPEALPGIGAATHLNDLGSLEQALPLALEAGANRVALTLIARGHNLAGKDGDRREPAGGARAVEMARSLVDAGTALPGSRRDRAALLTRAVEHGELALVAGILERRGADTLIDPDSFSAYAPIRDAAARWDVDALAVLHGAGYPLVNPLGGNTVLHMAVERGAPKGRPQRFRHTAEWALARGIDINAVNTGGDTALKSAADRGIEWMFIVLADLGADPYAGGEAGGSAAEHAARGWLSEALDHLAARGLDLTRRGASGLTLLHKAAGRRLAGGGSDEGFRRTLDVLLRAGIDIDARGDGGRSPLFAAVVGGDAQRLVALLEAGADASLRDAGGRTLHSYTDECWAAGLLSAAQAELIRGVLDAWTARIGLAAAIDGAPDRGDH